MHNAQVSSPISTKKRGFPLHKKCHITTCPQGRVIADLNDNDAQRKGKKRKHSRGLLTVKAQVKHCLLSATASGQPRQRATLRTRKYQSSVHFTPHQRKLNHKMLRYKGRVPATETIALPRPTRNSSPKTPLDLPNPSPAVVNTVPYTLLFSSIVIQHIITISWLINKNHFIHRVSVAGTHLGVSRTGSGDVAGAAGAAVT